MKPISFICLSSQYVYKVVGPSGQLYRFFRGRSYLVKNEKDAKFFKGHKMFKEEKAQETK